ncbi:MAG: deoxyribose-phosphate aldolase [Bacteroidales bacterium]|nr:deoxyribose-phosphate aldolase [Bacteroidales bacterium]
MKLLEKFNRTFTEKEVSEAVAKTKESSKSMFTPEYLKLAFSTIDLTSLNSSDTYKKIAEMTQKVNEFKNNFPEMPNVAAICVYPNFVQTVRKNLSVSGINLASVTGGFPSSQTFLEIKTKETRLCMQRGADEVDMVISVGEFLGEDYPYIHHEVKKIKQSSESGHLKVILETGLLENYDKIYKASILAMSGGGDFIKTSTGKEKIGSTPEAVYVMCCAIKDYYEETNKKIGLKPAGGISTPDISLHYLAIVKQVLGEDWLNNKFYRTGASSLANKLLSAIYEKEINYF